MSDRNDAAGTPDNEEHHSDPDRRIFRAPSGRIAEAYTAPNIDDAALERDLRAAVKGEVRFDDGSRALYATDASNYRQVPIGVVIPRTKADVIETVAVCRRYGAPILPRGGGTSLAGECCNTAVVIDFSKYLNRVLEIDPRRRLARVEPGCILDDLRDRAKKFGLTFGPDPATHDHNTLGGMIGNNSGGMHTLMNGNTARNVLALEILTYDGLQLSVGKTSDIELRANVLSGGRRGEIYRRLRELRDKYGDLIRARFPRIPRRVSGYENLDALFSDQGCNVARALVGTEGTCVVVLEATLELIPSPPDRVLVIAGFPDIFQAADAVPKVLEFKPVGLEGMDDLLVKRMRLKHLHEEDLSVLPKGKGWLIVEFGGASEEEAAASGQALADHYKRNEDIDIRLVRDKRQQKRIWNVRDSALGAESYVPNHPDTSPGWEDSAVHRENLGRYLRDLKALFDKYGYHPCLYGHFGDGLVHCTVAFDVYDEAGIAAWRRFMNEAADLIVRYNGSFSGEHGDGQARAELLEKMYGPELVEAFREFKRLWDPQGRMNPGKIVDPYPITSDLRLGPEYHRPKLKTYFAYPVEGNFVRAAQRCVGVGKCRRHDSGEEIMCPSYLATHEERHSTRGRSRLLFEMLHGGPIRNRWKSDAVEEALDLCLACKGCKADCPVQVDMAAYKAEFRAHHYAGRLRPRAAYSMGRINEIAKLASYAPKTLNQILNAPLVERLSKNLGGIASARTIPSFAEQSFTQWFRRRSPRKAAGRRVLLWPDTFNNYFRPHTAIAATRVLEAAGFQVVIPAKPLCCGRPLYDWGWLSKAKRQWERTLQVLKPEIEAGGPLIGLEPACLSAFRDELVQLLPNSAHAKRLREQSVFFSDFLAEHTDGLAISTEQSCKALVHIHCHHHAVIKTKGETKLLDALGIGYDVLPSGCCGMAGSFGFEEEKYEISQKLGERVLLPAIRSAPESTLVLSNGFSCREQIEQGTSRKTLHVAELVARRMGLETSP